MVGKRLGLILLIDLSNTGYFPVRYDSRVVIYERKMFIRLATGAGFEANVLRNLLDNI